MYAWWQRGVIYQIYPRSFKDSNGDGIGDLAGVIDSLDYLSETLGIDAIWLSPFYPSPMADFGYDITDFTDVDPVFGDLATFDELVAQAHRRDLKIIIDLVVAYTSDQHPWFQESRSARHNARRDWYLWADPKPDGSPPNNWLSAFGGSGWTWDAATGQYYFHSFTRHQPDLNWRSPGVRAAMLDVARFWLEREVDGFRIDAAHWILKDPLLRDNPPNLAPRSEVERSLGEYDSQLHLYDKGHPDVHEVFRAYRKLFDAYSAARPRLSVGEIHVFDWPVWATYYGKNLDELHMPLNFGLVGAAWKAEVIRKVVEGVEAALPPGAWPNYVLGNHDEPRVASRLGPLQARAAMLLLLTLRGTPTLYYGDEIGMENVAIPPEQMLDPWGKNNPALSRDPARTPMQWEAAPNAGFCPPQAVPWLPLAPDYAVRNVAAQRDDPRSMLALTRALLRLRKASDALAVGSYRPVASIPEGCFAFVRQAAADRRLVVVNFTADEQEVSLDAPGRILLSTYLDREEQNLVDSCRLRAYEACVVVL